MEQEIKIDNAINEARHGLAGVRDTWPGHEYEDTQNQDNNDNSREMQGKGSGLST